jgi:hypothetical protein
MCDIPKAGIKRARNRSKDEARLLGVRLITIPFTIKQVIVTKSSAHLQENIFRESILLFH